MPLKKIGEIVQAHNFAFIEDAIARAKKDAIAIFKEDASDARVLLYLDGTFIEVTPFTRDDILLDAWRRVILLGECEHTLSSGVYFSTPLVIEPRGSAEPLEYTPPSGTSRRALAQWRRAFLSELYIESRDLVSADVEPYVGWPNPDTYKQGILLPPGEKETSVVDVRYHFIIFWAKMIQKMMNEGVSFEEAALKGATQAHLLEVSLHEAKSILRLITTHLSKVWSHAQTLYSWYDSWVDSEFPQEVPPGIPEWLR